ncbi:hypothetical protein ACIP2X_08695 [Streptomyces sp. NPDC089424]|uniref:hypothetical protein n=1 Tax=Streptomyces sp. NPDC089424 TaxID=3365917 RepID=UPI003812B1D3
MYAHGQCRELLHEDGWRTLVSDDTARAADEVAELGDARRAIARPARRAAAVRPGCAARGSGRVSSPRSRAGDGLRPQPELLLRRDRGLPRPAARGPRPSELRFFTFELRALGAHRRIRTVCGTGRVTARRP